MTKAAKHSAFSKPKKTDSKKAKKNNVDTSKVKHEDNDSRSSYRPINTEGEQPYTPNHVQIEPLPPESHIN